MTNVMSRRAVLFAGGGTAAAAAVAAAFLVAGSEIPASAHPAEEPSVTAVYTPAVHASAMPMDAYHLTGAQEAELSNQQNLMNRACMKSFGLSYLPNYTDRTKVITASFAVNDSRRYGISDPVAASRFGYHLPPQPATKSSATGGESDTSPMAMSPDKYQVFTGARKPSASSSVQAMPDMQAQKASPGSYHGKAIPAGGCAGQTNRKLLLTTQTPQVAKANQLAANLNQDAFGKSIQDAKAVKANGAWRKCMTGKGYGRYASPLKAAAAFDLNQPPTKAEIETAVADVACQQQVNYVSTLTAIEKGYQKRAIAKHTAGLAPLKAQVTEQSTALTKAIQTSRG
ncbi:hypothetical protein [Actinomadura opuntiae]|uniref:hypothetical protein n=1 Tax=Actinomadura sp. OS1-43 TaxID=604315 RepID=UPI00255AB7C6|nr:hypothetical protein [Actinomadura sp. OS1-43]MDL4813095.1 hypothetical protein [Actinomadura sp. OS1-43]